MGEKLLITHRESAVLLERARIRVNGGRLVYDLADSGTVRTFSVPYANLAVLFLGQGCSITTDACRKLAEEGVFMCMTGSGGTPITFGTLVNYRPTNHFRRAMTVWLSPEISLEVAKKMAKSRITNMMTIGMRNVEPGGQVWTDAKRACDDFEAQMNKARSGNELLGAEGAYARGCYAAFAKQSPETKSFVREPRKRSKANTTDIANGLIDHGNYLVAGLAGATLWALGVPPHLSVLHGRTRAGGLVFDLADVFKDSLILPAAFDTATDKTQEKENVFRARVLEEMDRRKTLEKMFSEFEKVFPEEKA